jgi:hypothetical protein
MLTNAALPEWVPGHHVLYGDTHHMFVLDIPWSLAANVLRALARRHVHGRVLFGGLDGAMMDLKERFFAPYWDTPSRMSGGV